ncbi:MarR family transcriptional regulator [Nocardia sp. NBC_00565]|uniref:MarR family winged helix-turn-helix transcriptional regulator n=1 Tax=Nocardia sp. NBC_00565 TaxID=2975993 RepID=UPI002E7FF334|nr:MarR family transcriptional regulator [Nocardia sp. NBC_00565]WUC01199.1 MarR family transcriptional regulator [Nocardia sp. NBC_00565]
MLGRGPLAAGELSAQLELSPAATTTVIDRLVRAGFVTRTQDQANRRRVLVAATEAAQATADEIFGPVGRAGAKALARYNSEQLAVILDFLRTALEVHRAQTDHQVAALSGNPAPKSRPRT